MPFIYKEMSLSDRKKVQAIQLPEYTIFFKLNPSEWIIDKDEDIYLVYLTCTDGTHASKDFVQTITFLLTWKGNPIVVRMADKFNGKIMTYAILEINIPKELDGNINEIINSLRDALVIYSRRQVEVYY